MADDTRDAKLILRAEDRATKTFDAVAKSIANVREQLQQQAKAAESGQGSLDELQASYKALKQAGDDLVKQQAAINAFKKTSEAADRTATRVESATKALTDYQTKLAGQDKVTDAQTAKLDRLTATVDKLTTTYNNQAARVGAARDALSALGLSADKTEEQLTLTAESAKLVASGLLDAQKAIDGYEVGLRSAAAAAAELAAKDKLLAEAAKVGVDASQFQDENELTAAIERQKIALDDLAAADKAEAAAARIRRDELISTAKEVASGNPILEEQFVLLERLANEEKQASGFRQLGQDAQAAATDLSRFSNTATDSQASITRLADAIRSTVAPAVAEVQTLDGALKQVEESASVAADSQRLRVSQYQDSLNKLTQAQAALVRQAAAIDAFKAQQNVLAGLEADLGAAAEKYRLLGVAVERAGPDAADLAKQLAAARRELESIGTSTQNAGTKLEQLGNALKRVGIDINDVDGEFGRLQAGATRSAATVETLTTKVGGNGGGFLGLKPYELQNLSYQINDVFTSLASGISPTQTLAQQGGQIAQIFPQVLATFVRLLPVIIPVAAAIGLVAEAIHRVNTEAQAQRDFGNLFKLAGDDATYSAQQFATVQIQLQAIGVSASDAKATLVDFANAGLNPANLQTFLFVTQKLSDTLGISLPDAAKTFSAALTGGVEQVQAFQEQTHSLTQEQLTNIETLLRNGDVLGAHNALLQDAFTNTSKLADAQTPLTNSLRDVKNAFLSFEDVLGGFLQRSGAIQGALLAIAGSVRVVTAAFSDAAHPLNTFLHPLQTLKDNFNSITGKQAPVLPGVNTALTANGKVAPKAPVGNAGSVRESAASLAAYDKITDSLKEQLDQTKKISAADRVRLAGVKAVADAENQGVTDPTKLAAVRTLAASVEQAKVDKENAAAAKSAQAAADKAARAAEERQNKINSLTKELADTFAKFTPENVQDPYAKLQSDAEQAVTNIRAKFAQLAKLGVTTVNGKTEADFEAQVAGYEAEQVAAQHATDAEKTLNTLLEQRKTALAEIEDQVAAGTKTPQQGLTDSIAVIDSFTDKIRAAGADATGFLQKLTPTPQTAAQLAAVAKQVQSVSDASVAAEKRAAANKDIKSGIDQLNALTGARDEYVKLENQLVTAGLETSTDAQAKIKAAYDQSTPSIEAQAKAVQSLLDQAYLTGTVGYADYLKYSAQVKLAADETNHLTANQVTLKNAATNALSTGISTFITSIGTSLADAIKGTKSLGDVFKDIGSAALSFAASFTQAIAQAIIQIIALKAAQAILKNVGFSSIGLHDGGIVGQDATFHRRVPSEVFAGAVRYHTGGVVGLQPDEVPAILQKGEEVITASDPRNRKNGGLTPATPAAPNIKIVNTIDSGEFVSQGANTEVGQKAILNLIGNNASAVKAKLGIRN